MPESVVTNRFAWLPKLLLAVTAPLLAFGVLEVALRLAGFGYDARFFIPDAGGPEGSFRANPRFTERFFPASFGLKPANFRITRDKEPEAKRVFLLGESAAMGVPEPGFGMAPQLEAILRRAYPEDRVEVYNLGVTAINSHSILPIVSQAVDFDPDLLVFYMGNNEVVGPFGPGSAFAGSAPPRAAIRTSLWLKGTRVGQLLERLAYSLGRSASSHVREWRGMEMFAEKAVPYGDPRLEAVYGNFETNLRDMLAVAGNAGVPSVVSTVAVNHADCPPFVPDVGPGGEDAETYYQRGRQLLSEGRLQEAAPELRHALEGDALRFRADTRINEIIREVAADFESARLVDAAQSLFPGGRELFFEHVHLTFEGNYEVSRELAAVAAPLLSPGADLPPAPSSAEVAADLAFTPVARLDQWQAMDELIARPPFTGQSSFAEDRAYALRKMRELSERITPKTLERAAALIEAARAADPRSARLALQAAKLAMRRGEFSQALERIDEYERLAPAVAESKVLRAFVLARHQRPGEAVSLLRSTIESEPHYSWSYTILASLWMSLGELEEGRAALAEWVEQMPYNRSARLAYAHLLNAAGEASAAAEQWQAALERVPDDERALLPLIEYLFERDRIDEALDLMLTAHEYNPRNFANNDLLVQVYRQHGDDKAALHYMRDLMASGPVSPELRRDYQALLTESSTASP